MLVQVLHRTGNINFIMIDSPSHTILPWCVGKRLEKRFLFRDQKWLLCSARCSQLLSSFSFNGNWLRAFQAVSFFILVGSTFKRRQKREEELFASFAGKNDSKRIFSIIDKFSCFHLVFRYAKKTLSMSSFLREISVTLTS